MYTILVWRLYGRMTVRQMTSSHSFRKSDAIFEQVCSCFLEGEVFGFFFPFLSLQSSINKLDPQSKESKSLFTPSIGKQGDLDKCFLKIKTPPGKKRQGIRVQGLIT